MNSKHLGLAVAGCVIIAVAAPVIIVHRTCAPCSIVHTNDRRAPAMAHRFVYRCSPDEANCAPSFANVRVFVTYNGTVCTKVQDTIHVSGQLDFQKLVCIRAVLPKTTP